MQATSIKRGPVTIRAKNPVISGRVDEALLRKVRAAAKKSGRSLSEELAFRANQSFAWEEALIEARKVIDHANLVAAGTVRQYMLNQGYTPIGTSDGVVWAEPGSVISEGVRKALDEIRAKP